MHTINVGFICIKHERLLHHIYKERLLQSTSPVFYKDINLLDVVYEDETPQITVMDMRGDTLMGKMVATKQTSWKYEEETRIVTDKFGRHDYLPSALHGIIFGTKMSEDAKKHIKESLTGRNIKFYQLYKKADTYGYLFNLLDEYKIPSLFSDNMYVYKLFSNPVVDNFYVRLNFKPKDKKEVIEFIEAFRRKYTDRQHNIYVHDNETELERLTPNDADYDYLQKHLIAETMIGCCEIIFSHGH